jgi:hypothetical protein
MVTFVCRFAEAINAAGEFLNHDASTFAADYMAARMGLSYE